MVDAILSVPLFLPSLSVGRFHGLPVGQAALEGGEVAASGVEIAIVGITIVFVALILISLFIAALPKILQRVAEVWPEVEEHHAISREGHPESQVPDEDPVIAAIGFVLHTEFQRQLAAERAGGGKPS